MLAIFNPVQNKHQPRFFLSSGTLVANTEVAKRAKILQEALLQHGHQLEKPGSHGMQPVAAIHRPDYLHFLKTIYQRWQLIEGASEEVIPNIHPTRPAGGYPESAVGQAGWHMTDTACPIGPDTWESALASANTAADAAQHVLDGLPSVYALCRPPGHHAYAGMAGGFCYLNNTAIAAQHLRSRFQRVAILDVDLHHGNGTQSIFYERADVMTVSLHADPASFYPFFWGYSNERGQGPGTGCNLNFPLPRLTQDENYIETLGQALDRIDAFGPQALVVALGLDAYGGDPLAGLSITTKGFGRIGAAISEMKLPTVLVQEGGYLSKALGDNLISFLEGFEKADG